jgi:Ca-activated chloride channel family protein
MVDSSIALYAASAAFILSLTAEFLHIRRGKSLAHLAFGPDAKPRRWTLFAPILRIIALVLLVWGFAVLMLLTPKAKKDPSLKENQYRRVIILLDVSPSMQIRDGGVSKSDSNIQQTRAQRGAQIVDSLLQRLYLDEIRFSVVAFYTGAKTVVQDTKDPSIIRNIMQDLPIIYAFEGGETNLFAGLKHTFEMAKDWQPKSATVIMITDGDTIPSTGMPKMPDSISKLLVVGVGDATKGTNVNDHLSRQNTAALRELAARLGVDYQNANSKQLSSTLINELTISTLGKNKRVLGIREYARYAILIGGIILFVLPLLLEKFGCQWESHRKQPKKL